MGSVAVVGSRAFSDYSLLKSVLDSIKPDVIVSGGAVGTDLLAKKYAEEKAIPIREFLPDYDRHGRSAPIVRNKDIVNASDKIVAFWDGSSKGTKFTIDYALNQNKPVNLVNVSKSFSRSDVIGEPVDRSEAWSKYLDSKRVVKGAAAELKYYKSLASSIEDPEERFLYSQEKVKSLVNISKYSPLKDKDNVFLVMPSSSGNKFPFALATELQKNFGGRIIDDFADQNHASGIKKLSGIQKVLSDRSFSLKEDFVKSFNSLKSKNIVLVDDLVSTGLTIDTLRAELNRSGLKTDFICSLVNTSASLCNENSIDKIAQKVSPSEMDFSEYREKTGVVFKNCLGGAAFHIIRGMKSNNDCDLVRKYVDKKYSEYVMPDPVYLTGKSGSI